MIIDGENLILGRLASSVAKSLLIGEKIQIVNCNNIVITGNKRSVIKSFKEKVIERGDTFKGPFYPKTPERIVKRVIRGMLPKKSIRGREALKNVMCYNILPDSIKKEELVSLEHANINNKRILNFIKLKDICKEIGKYGK